MSETISITIKLGNRAYRVKVAPENESIVREKMKLVQDKMDVLKKQFPGRDDLDYVSMTIIDYFTSLDDNKKSEVNDNLLTQLQNLHSIIDS